MKINQIKAGAILTYLTMGLGVLTSLVYTPFMLRMLPQGEYGLYTIALSVIGYLSILSFGLNSSYVRFYFKEKKQDEKNGVANLNGSCKVQLVCPKCGKATRVAHKIEGGKKSRVCKKCGAEI